jgi:hypothetical protein
VIATTALGQCAKLQQKLAYWAIHIAGPATTPNPQPSNFEGWQGHSKNSCSPLRTEHDKVNKGGCRWSHAKDDARLQQQQQQHMYKTVAQC